MEGASAAEIKRETRLQGTKTLRESAMTKLREGMITVDEVVRTTAADERLDRQAALQMTGSG